ncbi:DUF397 domain-containing protein [Spirillospora sp. NPDC052242]
MSPRPGAGWRRSSYSTSGENCVEVVFVANSPDHSYGSWRKSSRSGSGDCVEVAGLDGRCLVRDSKDPNGPVLALTSDDWRAFTRAIKDRAS